MSADAVQHLVAKHVAVAQDRCPALKRKRVSPHVMRHTAAMELLQSGVEPTVIALWLGHESTKTTQVYLDAHLALKEAALARVMPFDTVPGRFKPPDELLQFLRNLQVTETMPYGALGQVQCWRAKPNAMRRSFSGGIEIDTAPSHHALRRAGCLL